MNLSGISIRSPVMIYIRICIWLGTYVGNLDKNPRSTTGVPLKFCFLLELFARFHSLCFDLSIDCATPPQNTLSPRLLSPGLAASNKHGHESFKHKHHKRKHHKRKHHSRNSTVRETVSPTSHTSKSTSART